MNRDRVLTSLHNESVDRCVDFFVRPDGSFGYKQFRLDPEDMGTWSMTAFDERGIFDTYQAALDAALGHIVWLREAVARARPFVP
jgi:hypothetical protein